MIQGRGWKPCQIEWKAEDVNILSLVVIGLLIVLHDVEQVTALIVRHNSQGLFSNLYSNTILNEAKYLKGHQRLATLLSSIV